MADDMRTLGYICPKCGAQVMGARSAFALEASDAEIECSCGGSVLRTNYDGQNYHILVPCGVCGQTHEAVCPPERMLHAATALITSGRPALPSPRKRRRRTAARRRPLPTM